MASARGRRPRCRPRPAGRRPGGCRSRGSCRRAGPARSSRAPLRGRCRPRRRGRRGTSWPRSTTRRTGRAGRRRRWPSRRRRRLGQRRRERGAGGRRSAASGGGEQRELSLDLADPRLDLVDAHADSSPVRPARRATAGRGRRGAARRRRRSRATSARAASSARCWARARRAGARRPSSRPCRPASAGGPRWRRCGRRPAGCSASPTATAIIASRCRGHDELVEGVGVARARPAAARCAAPRACASRSRTARRARAAGRSGCPRSRTSRHAADRAHAAVVRYVAHAPTSSCSSVQRRRPARTGSSTSWRRKSLIRGISAIAASASGSLPGGVGADLDELADVAVRGEQPAQRRRRPPAARAW